MNIKHYIFTLLSVLALTSCSTDDDLMPETLPGGEVEVCLDVTKAGVSTRASLTQESTSPYGLKSAWASTDKIYVYTSTGKIGELTYKTSETDGLNSKGAFYGTLTTTGLTNETDVHLYYLGIKAGATNGENNEPSANHDLTLNLAPCGSASEATKYDVASATVKWSTFKTFKQGTSDIYYVSATLKNHVSFVFVNNDKGAGAISLNKALKLDLKTNTVTRVHATQPLSLESNTHTLVPIVPQSGDQVLFTGLNPDGYVCYVPCNGTIEGGHVYTLTHTDPCEIIVDTHQAVDLGLPRGIYWANMNVGASSVSDGGDYYNWGKTTYAPPESSNFSTITTGILDESEDTATQLWGKNWRMPTVQSWNELVDNCTIDRSYDENNILKGCIFTGKGDFSQNSVFINAAGRYGQAGSLGCLNEGFYFASNAGGTDANNDQTASGCWFSATDLKIAAGTIKRYVGFSVRPVCQ